MLFQIFKTHLRDMNTLYDRLIYMYKWIHQAHQIRSMDGISTIHAKLAEASKTDLPFLKCLPGMDWIEGLSEVSLKFSSFVKSYGFETTWGWAHDNRIFIFVWTVACFSICYQVLPLLTICSLLVLLVQDVPSSDSKFAYERRHNFCVWDCENRHAL